MSGKKKLDVNRVMKDTSILTPWEEEIYKLSLQGLKPKAISEALGGSAKPHSIAVRLGVIKEKIALKEIMDGQDRRISWP